MTVTETPAVARAVETSDRVASHLHPEGSFDVDAHPVPTGREEIWRFTPLKRLRGLATRTADADRARRPCTSTSELPAGRHRLAAHRARQALRVGSVLTAVRPDQRPARSARRQALAWCGRGPAGGRARASPCWCTLIGDGVETATAYGHTVVDRRRRTPSRRSCCALRRAPRRSPTTSRSPSGDGAGLTLVPPSPPGTPTRSRPQHVKVQASAATPRSTHVAGGARRGAGPPVTSASSTPDRGGECERRTGCTSPTPGSIWSTGSWSTTTPRTAAATSRTGARCRARGARGLGRRRPHPRRGDRGHGHLRDEPQPRPHRRRPGRLRTEPGDRDRREAGAGHASATGRFDDKQPFYLYGPGYPGG